MPAGILIKFRSRFGAKKVGVKVGAGEKGKTKKVKEEEGKLEAMEERLEHVTDEVMEEIDKIERLKKASSKKKSEFSWIKGQASTLLIQDFVGAGFGAIIFVFTQEVWEIALRLNILSVIAIILISLIIGFSLIYLSRRRKYVSMKIFHTVALRVAEIYVVSFLTSLLFILIFGIFGYEPLNLFRGSVLIALPAVISAATADLLFY